jgi:hypothetical protein
MAFETILDAEIQVGKPTRRKIFTKIKNALDEHEDRINSLAVGAAPIEIFNADIINSSSASTLTGLLHHEIIAALRITKVKIQIFSKGLITSGQLQIDIKKNSSPDDIGMESLFTTRPTIDFSTASDFQSAEGVFDITKQNLTVGEFLRLDVTALPSLPLTRFRVVAYGVI